MCITVTLNTVRLLFEQQMLSYKKRKFEEKFGRKISVFLCFQLLYQEDKIISRNYLKY